MKKKKDAAAVSMGKRGGRKRAEVLTQKQRSDIARRAAEARWKKAKGIPPVSPGK